MQIRRWPGWQGSQHRGQAMMRSMVGAALAMVLALLVLPVGAEAPVVEVPDGFEDIAITEVYGSPTDLAWLGDDLLIASQEGWLFRLDEASPDATPLMILDVSAQVGKGPEQGLLGVVPDPDFPERPYIYVYYTRDRGTGHCTVAPADCHNRLSRFTMGADGLLDPASEQTLLDTIMVGGLHNAGDLAFDVDKQLYVSTGDAAYWGNAQDLTNLNGKILRLDRDGNPSPENPFAGPESVPCQLEIRRDGGDPCPEIFAWGLRNPFRMAFDPSAADTVFFINDVGQETWEEIEVGLRGANYGWPAREGWCPTAEMTGCEPSDAYIEPVYAYPHEIGCFAITGGAFVPAGSPWGESYAGRYLFADWGCGKIFMLEPGADGAMTATPLASGLTTITPLLFSPDGSTLYYGREGGIIRAIGRTAPL